MVDECSMVAFPVAKGNAMADEAIEMTPEFEQQLDSPAERNERWIEAVRKARTIDEIPPRPECGARNGTQGSFRCNLSLGHAGDHCERVTIASWSAE